MAQARKQPRHVSVTEARRRLGALLREVAEGNEPVVVEQAGRPYALLLSVRQYEHLHAEQPAEPDWRELLARAQAAIASELANPSASSPEQMLAEARADRDGELLGLH